MNQHTHTGRIAAFGTAAVLFACWIAWELIHAPLVPELLDGCFSEEDDEETREKENSV